MPAGGVPEVAIPAGALALAAAAERTPGAVVVQGAPGGAASVEAAADAELAQRFGTAGRERAIREFSWATIAQQTVDIYRSLM